jgi:hypothetical protein
MSPELTEALNDKEVFLALKRLYTYKRLRELGAPPVIVEGAGQQLDRSKKELGARYAGISARLFVEFKEIEDATILAEQNWEAKCQTCVFWTDGYQGRDDKQWCGRHSFETRTIPDACPDFQLKTDGENDVER